MLFRSRVSIAARRERIQKLKQQHPSSPRRRLAIQVCTLASSVLLAPFFLPGGAVAELAEADYGGGGPLAIDSPTFMLDTLAMTEDGFLIKNAGQSAEVDNSGLSDPIKYTIESGDVLSSIARRFGVSMDTIIWENNISNPQQLKPGTELSILPVSGVMHEVKAGDTLAAVAKKYGVEADKISKQNSLADGTELVAGAKIIVPGGKKIIAAPPASKRNYIASAPGTYASYRAPASVDGAIIVANGAQDKDGAWMIKPTNGNYSQYFKSGHWAVDIADRGKPPIHAAADGTVVKSQCGWNGGYGCVIVIDHGDGFQTLYAHLSELAVSAGDSVKQSQKIGTMGNTGRVYGATGIHLHFEVVDNGTKRNPLAFY
ncbi:MAG: peptidoglycan DD-metalloendopeptidase family protein [Patescibacteria group bacterium]